MAKVRFKVDQADLEDVGKDSGDFVLPPKGYYVMQVKECNAGFSKTDGVEDKKKPRLEVISIIIGVGREGEAVTENYGQVWDYVSFSKESGWKRGEFLYALGFIDDAVNGDIDMEIDTDEVVGQTFLARIKHDGSGDETRAKIAKMLRYSDEGDEAFAGDGGDEGGDDVFGGGEDDGGGDYLTEEGLNELDIKEVGRIAKEDFDLDPTEHIVKVKGKVDNAKTKAAVIKAILEAQGAEGGEEDGGSGDDEESPF